jgi:fructose/tagatose bisphosphate aldolase
MIPNQAETNKEMKEKTWRTAICISLVLHILLFSIAIRIGGSHAVYEPKPIEVELGAMSGVERHVGVSPKTAPPRIVKAASAIPNQDAVPQDGKQVIAPVAVSAPTAPTVVKEVSQAVTVSSSSGTAASQVSQRLAALPMATMWPCRLPPLSLPLQQQAEMVRKPRKTERRAYSPM